MGGWNYWAQMFLMPVYALSWLMPRDNRIWLFGSSFGNRFADNPRYLYLYINQHERNQIRPVWISRKSEIVCFLREQGYEAYLQNSWKGRWYCLRAGVYIYDNYVKDINHWLSAGAHKINTWHGIPWKKIQMDNLRDKVRYPENGWKRICYALRRFTDEKPSHYIIASSDTCAPLMASAFHTKHVLQTGYPRTDLFTTKLITNCLTPQEKACYEQIKQHNCKKVLMYMPTFRESEPQFFEVMDLEKFQQFLQKQEYLFCAKLHCKSKLRERFATIQSANIVMIDQNTDPYVYTELVDILITDYSSIALDYLRTDKPMVFFPYDQEEYLTQIREMYFDYDSFVPGICVKTMEELEEALLCIDERSQEENIRQQRANTFRIIYGEGRESVSPNLVREIENLLETNT